MARDPSEGFAEDLAAAASTGLGLDTFAYLTTEQFDPGQLADFLQLDPEAQSFVLRVLGGLAGATDYARFDRRDDAKAVAAWMLELPALRRERPDGP